MNRMLERMNHVLLAVAVLAVLSLTSCEHKDLCHDSLHVVNVKVVFDWRKAPDAAPASMSLYLFPTDGGEALRYEFTDRNGGSRRALRCILPEQRHGERHLSQYRIENDFRGHHPHGRSVIGPFRAWGAVRRCTPCQRYGGRAYRAASRHAVE